MLIVKYFLNGDYIGLKDVVRTLNKKNGAVMICQVEVTLTAYADAAPTPAMMVIMTCSLIVNGPGLSGMPKKEIFGR